MARNLSDREKERERLTKKGERKKRREAAKKEEKEGEKREGRFRGGGNVEGVEKSTRDA